MMTDGRLSSTGRQTLDALLDPTRGSGRNEPNVDRPTDIVGLARELRTEGTHRRCSDDDAVQLSGDQYIDTFDAASVAAQHLAGDNHSPLPVVEEGRGNDAWSVHARIMPVHRFKNVAGLLFGQTRGTDRVGSIRGGVRRHGVDHGHFSR